MKPHVCHHNHPDQILKLHPFVWLTEEDGERGGAGRKRDSSRKRDGKKDKKEKGYTMFEEEDSEEEIILPDDVK